MVMVIDEDGNGGKIMADDNAVGLQLSEHVRTERCLCN